MHTACSIKGNRCLLLHSKQWAGYAELLDQLLDFQQRLVHGRRSSYIQGQYLAIQLAQTGLVFGGELLDGVIESSPFARERRDTPRTQRLAALNQFRSSGLQPFARLANLLYQLNLFRRIAIVLEQMIAQRAITGIDV